jgi:hypothetical protein
MKLSYEAIGQWAATFACSGVSEGSVVKISAGGTVGGCAAGDAFCGTVVSIAHGGDACSVALGGMVTAAYTGTAPAAGFAGLSADGSGGVRADAGGRSYLVADVDPDAKTVTFVL